MAPGTRISHLFDSTRKQRRRSTVTTPIPVSIATREPVPLDPTRPSVAQLPDPIVRQILTFLHDTHPEDLRRVALLSSSCHEQARYVQHGHVQLNLDKSKHVLDRLHLIERLDQLRAVRRLRVTGWNREQTHYKILDRLAALLPGMTGLRHLDWDVDSTRRSGSFGTMATMPIPEPILSVLPDRLRLHTSVHCQASIESHARTRVFLNRLVGNQHLSTLRIYIRFIEEQMCVGTMRALKKVILSCPNLTRIPSMDVWYPREGCNGYGPPFRGGPYCGLGFSNGEKPPALEELGITFYPWGIEGVPYCQGFPTRGKEWDYWADTFDWTRLVRLNGVPSPLASELAPRLTNLRELVYVTRTISLETSFLQDLNSPLELMHLADWNLVKWQPDLITRFGETLQALKMHEPEPDWGGGLHGFATAADIARLSESLPHLRHIAIDITRNQSAQEWPYDMLDAIAAFPDLQTVELWFPLGLAPPAPKPLLTISSASHLFHYLRKRNKRIRRVTIHSGAPLPGFDFMIGKLEPSWAMCNTVSFECEMVYDHEISDEKGGRLKVSCPELSSAMNAKLHRLAQQADRELPDPASLDVDALRLWVALDGPINSSQFHTWRSNQLQPGRKTKRIRGLTFPLWKKAGKSAESPERPHRSLNCLC